jgi:RecJ-like exonuclease
MSTDIDTEKRTIQDQLESQLKNAEAKLDALKAQAKSVKTGAEVKATGELLARKRALELELKALKKLGGDKWNQAKASLEAHIADFEESVGDAESKSKDT